MTTAATRTTAREAPARATVAGPLNPAERLQAIDILRGLVIVLMVLDHVRDFFHATAFAADPLDVAVTSPALYATRWITHFCAPTFVFLAGASAYLQLARGKSPRALAWFLFTRGLWLVVLELTVINLAWSFTGGPPFLQVIWAIGVSMMVLAALVFLPSWMVLAIGAAILAGHNTLDPLQPAQFAAFAPGWSLLHEGGLVRLGSLPIFAAYPLIPWIGVMCLGYGMGRLFLLEPGRRARAFLLLGGAMIAAFLLLRGLNLYGDPSHWTAQPQPWQTVGAFLNVQKYPPSLLFVLTTLGPIFLLVPLFDRLKGPVAEFFLTYGRVPLCAYVLHILIAHAIAQAVSSAMGYPVWGILTAATQPELLKGWGFGLPVVYGVWALVLALLYPLCRWFADVKRRRRGAWWVSYV